MDRDAGSNPEEEDQAEGYAEEGSILDRLSPDTPGHEPGVIAGQPWSHAPPIDERIAQRRDYEAEREAQVDARYEAMTPEQRDKAYVHPGLLTRIKRFWTGA